MPLLFVGLGYSLRHLTAEAIDAISGADIIYIDTYTSIYEDDLGELRKYNPRAQIYFAKRRDLEGSSVYDIIAKARDRNVVIAVPGDPFIATTHDAIRLEALKAGIEVKVINGLSIFTLIHSRLGLQAYKFGKSVTLVYPEAFKPYSVIEVIYDNLARGLHTIVLLDLRLEEGRAMTIPEAVKILLELDEKGELGANPSVGVARMGWRDEFIVFDKLSELSKYAYPPPPHTIVICGRLHPVEREVIEHVAAGPRGASKNQ